MQQEHGKTKAMALRRFDAVATLSRETAMDILRIMWPNAEKASPAEFAKAVGLCVDYGLDPRLNELFLIPFKNKVRDDSGKVTGYKTVYETVRGIRATRKVALRKHKYSYVDFTPRLMTEEEEKRAYKKGVDPERIRYITKLKDMESGAEAPGYGEWPMYKMFNGKKVLNNPKGIDKGNSIENMAAIRSERAALERLYPADMPSSRIPVVDEQFIDAEFTEVPDEPFDEEPEDESKVGEHVDKGNGEEGESAQTTLLSSEVEDKSKKSAAEPAPASTKPKVKRDPETIKSIAELYKACHEDWDMQPKDVIKELGYSSQTDIVESPRDCYKTIASVRGV